MGGHAKGKKKRFKFRWYLQVSTSQKDPDAMDVDRLAVEIQCLSYKEQKKLMEKGLCFGCKKPGHYVYNCPDKKKNPPKARNGYKGKGKPKAHATFTQIRALVSELSDGEMAEFQDLTDKEGLLADEEEGEEEDQDF